MLPNLLCHHLEVELLDQDCIWDMDILLRSSEMRHRNCTSGGGRYRIREMRLLGMWLENSLQKFQVLIVDTANNLKELLLSFTSLHLADVFQIFILCNTTVFNIIFFPSSVLASFYVTDISYNTVTSISTLIRT